MNTIASRLSTLEAALDQLRRGTGGADGPRTLTQILDLVVLCDQEREATAMRKVLAKLPANRPSRALIALAQHEPRETEAEASLVEYAGGSSDAPKLASEVVQLVSGDGGVALPAAIAGLLLPDLPVYLLLRLDPSRWPALVDGVWPLASRIVVDSTHEASALMTVPELIARPPRVPVTDLSWTKLTGWRDTVARLFDDPRGARSLGKLTRLSITHVGRSSAQARLMAAWVSSRTGIRPRVEISSIARRDMRSGSLVSVELGCGKEEFSVHRVDEGVAEVRSPNLPVHRVRLHVPAFAELLSEELELTDHDAAFEDAVATLASGFAS